MNHHFKRCSTAYLSPNNSSVVFLIEVIVNSSSFLSPLITLNYPFSEVTGNEKIRSAGTPYKDPSVSNPADCH
jgi:hypothetical protein